MDKKNATIDVSLSQLALHFSNLYLLDIMRTIILKTLFVGALMTSIFCCVAQDPVDSYIDEYRDLAITEMERTGIPASIKLGQAILESNAGQSTLATKAKNHFGIKCGKNWNGKSMKKKDDDYVNGRLKKSCFRAYRKNDDSFLDHSEFLMSGKRYDFLFDLDGKDYKKWAKGLKKAGYATAKDYHKKLIEVIERYKLHQYDDWGTEMEEVKEEVVKEEIPTLEEITPTGFLYNNDVKYILAQSGETVVKLAQRCGTPAHRLLRYNEGLESETDLLTANERIYVQPKRNSYRGRRKWHEVKSGETMYLISQMYGLRLDFLLQRNAMQLGDQPATGAKVKINGGPLSVPPPLEGSKVKEALVTDKDNELEMEEEVIEIDETDLPESTPSPIIPDFTEDEKKGR